MTQHDHREYVEGCYRCELSCDETAHAGWCERVLRPWGDCDCGLQADLDDEVNAPASGSTAEGTDECTRVENL